MHWIYKYIAFGSLLTVFYVKRWTIIDYALLMKIRIEKYKKKLLDSPYEILSCKLYDKNDKLLEDSNYSTFTKKYKNSWTNLELFHPTVNYFRMKYKFNYENTESKIYQIVYCKGIDLKIPPYKNNDVNKSINNFTILTATDKETNKDVTEEVNQILGPKQNYYSDLNIKLKPRWFNLGTIMVMDNNINEYEIDKNDYFMIKN